MESIKYAYENNGFEYPVLKDHITRPGFWFPDSLKRHLRPLVEPLNKISLGFLFPDCAVRVKGIDPYWFRNS